MNSLPLSWSITESISEHEIISNKKIAWYAIENLPSVEQLIDIVSTKDTEIIIRGCSMHLVGFLEQHGFSSLQFGLEAVLKTTGKHFNKRSLKELMNRARKKGKVKKIDFSESNREKLKKLARESIHGIEPQLINLFQTKFGNEHELFVYENENNEWLAATMLSKNSYKKLHTELLLRKKNAPNGAMELLIKAAFDYAAEKKYDEISLGEVPFLFSDYNNNMLGRLLKMSSTITNYAYNHKGLFNFKNKFNPNWEPLYICATPKIKIRHLIFIMHKSNFRQLLLYKTKFYFKNHFIQNKGKK